MEIESWTSYKSSAFNSCQARIQGPWPPPQKKREGEGKGTKEKGKERERGRKRENRDTQRERERERERGRERDIKKLSSHNLFFHAYTYIYRREGRWQLPQYMFQRRGNMRKHFVFMHSQVLKSAFLSSSLTKKYTLCKGFLSWFWPPKASALEGFPLTPTKGLCPLDPYFCFVSLTIDPQAAPV